ncbi:MAG: immunoglobulin-like domain-containing protein [Candidatus Paceibacterota bacterium]
MPTKFFLTILGGLGLFLVSFVLPLNLACAITIGPNNPGTNVDDSSVGKVAWTNRDDNKTSNDKYATTQGMNSGSVTVYLKATNFGFSIPAEAIIDGIVVAVERKASDKSFFDNAIRIVKEGKVGSEDKSSKDTWLTTDSTVTYGGPSDLWGETWTSSDINSKDFGLAVSVKKVEGATNQKPSIDWVNISVSYHLSTKTPVISWADPEPITYGNPLNEKQLNATADVDGNFSYTPDLGTILDAGKQTLSVLFTPKDLIEYAPVTTEVVLLVAKGEQIIDWSNPADLTFGDKLSGTELNATVKGNEKSMPEDLIYDPPLGTELPIGTHTLSVVIPATDNYNEASKTVEINILPIPIVNSAPIVSSVAITGTSSLGQILTGSYLYSDVDNDLEGKSTFRWLRDNVVIDGETASTYTLRTSDFGTTIKFEVTPLALTGATTGTPVSSAGIAVVDTTKPVITLNGSSTINLLVGDSYVDAGVMATDDVDGDITGRVVASGLPVDTTVSGTSTIRYNVSDLVGNQANEVARTLIVKEAVPIVSTFTPILKSTSNGPWGYVTLANSRRATPQVLGVKAYNWQNDLSLNSSGDDVKMLQKFLNAKGFPVAKTGLGSIGKETNKFGALTRAALIKFQKANGIKPASGYFGPKTRVVMKKI